MTITPHNSTLASSSVASTKIGFIGGGNMASSLIGGLLKQGQVEPENLSLFEPSEDKANALASQYGLTVSPSNEALVAQCDLVVIAVKPQVLKAVLTPLADAYVTTKPLIVSVVAGITAESIQAWLATDCPIVRVMPNTPALIGKGASGMYANASVSNEQRQLTEQLMGAVGTATWVAAEQDIDSVTALSGSGPAYFMLFIKSLIESAESAGLDSDAAKALALQTAIGATELVASSDLSLQTLIDNVTSPNGTTEQALLSFHNDDLPGIVRNAFNAAKRRSEELAKELS